MRLADMKSDYGAIINNCFIFMETIDSKRMGLMNGGRFFIESQFRGIIRC